MMFRIGDFARLSRVSVKMLRNYDELGLLKPAHVDSFTSYRYYMSDQLPRLNRIVALKELGFSLDEIARLLDQDLSADDLRDMLAQKCEEIEQRLESEAQRLGRLRARLRQVEQENTLTPYEVIVRPVGPQLLATMAAPAETDYTVQTLFEQLERYVYQFRARADQAPLLLYHNESEDGNWVEVAVPIIRPIPAQDGVRVYELPGAEQMACIVHVGDYCTLGEASQTLMGWIESHAYMVDGRLREVFLRFGADDLAFALPQTYLTRTPDEFVTELQLPVKRPS